MKQPLKIEFGRKYYSISLLSAIILCMLSLTSTAQQSQPIGTWLVDIDKTIELMDTVAREKYDNLSQEVKERAINSMKNKEFVFDENGDFTSHWQTPQGDKSVTGQWTLNEAKDLLTLIINNQPREYGFEILPSNGIVLRNKIESGLFSNLFLIKK